MLDHNQIPIDFNDVDLTPKGEKQACDQAGALFHQVESEGGVDAIIVSTYKRALKTAKLVTEKIRQTFKLPVIGDELLRESWNTKRQPKNNMIETESGFITDWSRIHEIDPACDESIKTNWTYETDRKFKCEPDSSVA